LGSRPKPAAARAAARHDVRDVLASLEGLGTKRGRDGMARYGIVAPKAFGVSMADMNALAKRLGRDHDLAAALWKSGWYEARMLATLVDDPARVTAAQMDRWTDDFDNWAICDTACFKLFDRTPHAWGKVAEWAPRPEEFVRRTAFALLWSLALHDKTAADERFLGALPLVEDASVDGRNFVKKAVSMALRASARRSPAVRAACVALARRLAATDDAAARWIGRDALREFEKRG